MQLFVEQTNGLGDGAEQIAIQTQHLIRRVREKREEEGGSKSQKKTRNDDRATLAFKCVSFCRASPKSAGNSLNLQLATLNVCSLGNCVAKCRYTCE